MSSKCNDEEIFMPKLDGSVGQGAENKRHDVAVVQAALGKARGRDRKPYWPGPIV